MKKTFKTILKKLIILGIPLYILMVYAHFFPMRYMPLEYPMWQEEKDYIKNGASVDTVIIGDSRAKSSLIPEKLSPEGSIYNLAIGGSTPIDMYYALTNYLKGHEKPERIIMIFAPYHFCDIDNWNQTKAFNYLSTAELLEIYKEAALNNELSLFGENPLSDIISCKLSLPNKYLASIYDAGIKGNTKENLDKFNEVRSNLGYTEFGTADGDSGLNYETHHTWFDDSKTVYSYYKKIIALCVENDIELIAEQAPINEASNAVMNKEFMAGYKGQMKKALKPYVEEGKRVIRIKEVPVYPDKYFGDANHLNRKGAEKFTEEIRNKYFTSVQKSVN